MKNDKQIERRLVLKDEFEANIEETNKEIVSKIMNIKKALMSLGYDRDINIPNCCITANNKVHELARQFSESGISMYNDTIGEYDGNSIIGGIIIFDITSRYLKGFTVLCHIHATLLKILTKRAYDAGLLESNKFMAKIKKTINRMSARNNFQLNEEQKLEIEEILNGYKQLDDQIWNYTLDKNLFESILNYNEMQSLNGLFENNSPFRIYLSYILSKLELDLDIGDLIVQKSGDSPSKKTLYLKRSE